MQLTPTEIQQLTDTYDRFIANKTSKALSTLLGESIQHKLNILHDGRSSMECITLPDNEIRVCTVRLNGKGDIHIELLYTANLKHAIRIISKLLGNELTEIDEMGTSALQEVANIMTGSFFNALTENTNFKIDLSTPTFKEGELMELMKEPVNSVVCPTDHAIIADSTFWGEESGIRIHMIIIQHPEGARKLLKLDHNTAQHTGSSESNLIGGPNDEIDMLLSNIADEESEVQLCSSTVQSKE